MSETSARASRRAFWFGSFARNGLIGLRWTAAGAGAGVDGVENAADRLPVVVNDDGVAGRGAGGGGSGGGSGIDVRDGGVSGAPNIAPSAGVAPSAVRGTCPGVFANGLSSGSGDCSRWTVGVNLGENGGVRCLTGDGDDAAAGWLGSSGFGGGPAGGDAGWFRGTGGGHEVAPTCIGVFGRDVMDFTSVELPAATLAAGAGTVGNSSPQLTAAPTGMSPPQTEHRARMDTLVIFAGSSRKTVRHSGHETFIGSGGLVESAGLFVAQQE